MRNERPKRKGAIADSGFRGERRSVEDPGEVYRERLRPDKKPSPFGATRIKGVSIAHVRTEHTKFEEKSSQNISRFNLWQDSAADLSEFSLER